METLNGLKSGVYEVTTRSGTRHVVDLARRSLRRYGAPGHEWSHLSTPDGVPDGEEFFFTRISDATVGSRMYVVAIGSYADPNLWRLTSAVRSIEPYVEKSQEPDT